MSVMKTTLLIGAVTGSLYLVSCGTDELTRKGALEALEERYPASTKTNAFHLCTDEQWQQIERPRYTVLRGMPCEMTWEEREVYQPEQGESIFSVTKRVNGQTFGFKLSSGMTSGHFVDFNPDSQKITIHLYDWKIGEILGIRQAEGASTDLSLHSGREEKDCDALVEFTVFRDNFSTWGENYIEHIGKFPEVSEACFQKYDDGWRLITD